METKRNNKDTSTCADSKRVCSVLAANLSHFCATPETSATCGPRWTTCLRLQSLMRSMIKIVDRDSSASYSWTSGSILVPGLLTMRMSHKIKMHTRCPMQIFSRYLRMLKGLKMCTNWSNYSTILKILKNSRRWLASMFLCEQRTLTESICRLKEMSTWLMVLDANQQLQKNK